MSKRKGDTTKAVAYLRVSTDEQSLGPLAQRASIEAWASRHGVEVVAWHADHGVSGASGVDERPGLLASLDALRALDAGVLVVAKRDRLARDVGVALSVDRLAERAGARVVSADGTGDGATPEAALMRGIVDLLAAHERALIRSRTRAALAVKKARGERVGGIPLGRRLADDGTLVADAREAVVLERVRVLRASGVSVRGIVATLGAEGFRSRTDKPYGKSSVESMLRCHA